MRRPKLKIPSDPFSSITVMRLLVSAFGALYLISSIQAAARGKWEIAVMDAIFLGVVYMLWKLIRVVLKQRELIDQVNKTNREMLEHISLIQETCRRFANVALAAQRTKTLEQLEQHNRATWS